MIFSVLMSFLRSSTESLREILTEKLALDVGHGAVKHGIERKGKERWQGR
jgi:hypothetical protein